MSDFATKRNHDGQTSIYFNVENDKVIAIGEKMETINEQGYMNGYNWEAFINHYLRIKSPEMLDEIDTDSEAGTYVARYDEAESDKADKLMGIINGLINEPDEIYSFLKENGDGVEWD